MRTWRLKNAWAPQDWILIKYSRSTLPTSSQMDKTSDQAHQTSSNQASSRTPPRTKHLHRLQWLLTTCSMSLAMEQGWQVLATFFTLKVSCPSSTWPTTNAAFPSRRFVSRKVQEALVSVARLHLAVVPLMWQPQEEMRRHRTEEYCSGSKA